MVDDTVQARYFERSESYSDHPDGSGMAVSPVSHRVHTLTLGSQYRD